MKAAYPVTLQHEQTMASAAPTAKYPCPRNQNHEHEQLHTTTEQLKQTNTNRRDEAHNENRNEQDRKETQSTELVEPIQKAKFEEAIELLRQGETDETAITHSLSRGVRGLRPAEVQRRIQEARAEGSMGRPGRLPEEADRQEQDQGFSPAVTDKNPAPGKKPRYKNSVHSAAFCKNFVSDLNGDPMYLGEESATHEEESAITTEQLQEKMARAKYSALLPTIQNRTGDTLALAICDTERPWQSRLISVRGDLDDLLRAVRETIDMPAIILRAVQQRKAHHCTTHMNLHDELTHLHTVRLRSEAKLGEIRAAETAALGDTERLRWISFPRLHDSLTRERETDWPPPLDIAALVRAAIRAADYTEPLQLPCTTVDPEEIIKWQERGQETSPIALVQSTHPTAAEALFKEYQARRPAELSEQGTLHMGLLKNLIEAATRATMMRRGREVSYRDVQYAMRGVRESEKNKEIVRRNGRPPEAPTQAPEPENKAEMTTYLQKLADIIAELEKQGIQRPKVLIACERTQTIARCFQLAGVDVVSCDMLDIPDKARPWDIPHWRGDCTEIIDEGWDLVVGCPPCRALCIAGYRYLREFPERKLLLEEAAQFFLRLYHADTALGVCLENPRHHPAALAALGGLRPSCSVNPHEMGQGETKPTQIWMTPGMSPLMPTRHVLHRNKRLANLAPSIFRSDWRSEFYEGIALCAAATWTGDLIRFIQSRKSTGRRSPLSGTEIVERVKQKATHLPPDSTLGHTIAHVGCPYPTPTRLFRKETGWEDEHQVVRRGAETDGPIDCILTISLRRPMATKRLRKRHGWWHSFGPIVTSTDGNGGHQYGWRRLPKGRSKLIDNAIEDSSTNAAPPTATPNVGTIALERRCHERAARTIQRLWRNSSINPSRELNAIRTLQRWARRRATQADLRHDRILQVASEAWAAQQIRAAYLRRAARQGQPAPSAHVQIVATATRCTPDTLTRERVMRYRPADVLPTKARADVACAYVAGLLIAHHRRGAATPDTIYAGGLHRSPYLVPRAVCDTGAGPSIVTTELLAALPPDACVLRLQPTPANDDGGLPRMAGASGAPLVCLGKAIIIFTIDGYAYRHRFYIVEGKSLMLIGMDFLALHHAKIDLSNDLQHPASLVLPHPTAASGQITARLITRPVTLIEGRVAIRDLLTSEPDRPITHVNTATDLTPSNQLEVIESVKIAYLRRSEHGLQIDCHYRGRGSHDLDVIGGKRDEADDDLRATARREILEESGVDLQNIGRTETATWFTRASTAAIEMEPFECECLGPDGIQMHRIRVHAVMVDACAGWSEGCLVPRSSRPAEQAKAYLPGWRSLHRMVLQLGREPRLRPYSRCLWAACMHAAELNADHPHEQRIARVQQNARERRERRTAQKGKQAQRLAVLPPPVTLDHAMQELQTELNSPGTSTLRQIARARDVAAALGEPRLEKRQLQQLVRATQLLDKHEAKGETKSVTRWHRELRDTLGLDAAAASQTEVAATYQLGPLQWTDDVLPPKQHDDTPRDGTTTQREPEIDASLTTPLTNMLAQRRAAAAALQAGRGIDYVLFTKENMRIPPRTERDIRLRLPAALESHPGPFLVQRIPEAVGIEVPLLVATSLSYSTDGYVRARVLNLRDRPIFISEIQPIATLDTEFTAGEPPVLQKNREWEDLSAEEQELVSRVSVGTGHDLTADQKLRVRSLLSRYVDVFARDGRQTRTHAISVSLDLVPGAKPHRHQTQQFAPHVQDEIEKQTEKMLATGVIHRSTSGWSSRLLVVKKKCEPGETPALRICLDYRDLNSKLLVQDAVTPRIETALQMLGKARYFSCCDCSSAFHSLPLDPQSVDCTAFSTRSGRYAFSVLPFGLRHGPASLGRVMHGALGDLDYCSVYADDLLVHSSDFETHVEYVETMLLRLRWVGMSLNAKKSSFMSGKIIYLGHEITAEPDGRTVVRPDPSKLSAVASIQPDKIDTMEKLRSAIGLFSYFRKFCRSFGSVSKVLTDATKKGTDVAAASKGVAFQAAVTTLKEMLMSRPVLALPRDRMFYLKCDASRTAIGAVLTQKSDDGKLEHAIGYFGKVLTESQARLYGVTELELYAVIEACKHYRAYLFGVTFVLVTDHEPLRYCLTLRDRADAAGSSRLHRWLVYLSELSFTVVYTPGRFNSAPDGLSRLNTNPGGEMDEGEYIERIEAAYTPAIAPPETQQIAAVTATARGRGRPRKQNAAPATEQPTAASPEAATDAGNEVNQHAAHREVLKQYLRPELPDVPHLAAAQLQDPECRAIRQYVVDGTTDMSILTVRDARRLQRERQYWRVHDDILYRIAPSSPPRWRVYVPTSAPLTGRDDSRNPEGSYRHLYMSAFHHQMGHAGKGRMGAIMTQYVYWRGMQADIAEYVSQCHECSHSKHREEYGATRAPRIGDFPFDVLICDVLTLPKTVPEGYCKLLVFIDSLSRFVEAKAFTSDPTSEQVLDAFITEVLCRYGSPSELRQDNGSNLGSELAREFYSLSGVRMRVSNSYRHQTAGGVERYNDTIVSALRASDTTGGDRWIDHLPFLLFASRALPNRLTKESPAFLLYGRHVRPPIPALKVGRALISDLHTYSREMTERLRTAWQAAHRATLDGQEANKEQKDAAKPFLLMVQENDKVLLRIEKPGNKLAYRWDGPYRVQMALPNDNYLLTDMKSKRVHDRVHISRLRRYRAKEKRDTGQDAEEEDAADARPLDPDEYNVEAILKRRPSKDPRRGKYEYLIHWTGYRKGDATWEPRANLEYWCLPELNALDAKLAAVDAAREAATQAPTPTPTPAARPADVDSSDQPTPPDAQGRGARREVNAPPDTTPIAAHYSRRSWQYKTDVRTARGKHTTRWYPETKYTPQDLASAEFTRLRREFLERNPQLTEIIAALQLAEADD